MFYVYLHQDPITNEIVYVGKGSGGRAWDTTRNRKYCHPEHFKWIEDLLSKGFTPADYVRIISQGCSQQAAFAGEKEWMHERGQPKYNRTAGERNHMSKITDNDARNIYNRCKAGSSHQHLADMYGISRSAVSMIASRRQWRAATACLI